MRTFILSLVCLTGTSMAAVPAGWQPAATPPRVTAPGMQPEEPDFVVDVRALPEWATRPADRNAALNYWSAIASISKELMEAASKVDWEKVGRETDAAKMPQEFRDAAKMVAESGWLRQEVLIGSTVNKCDFEVRYEAGIGALLPHLGRVRTVVRIMRVEARHFLTQGKGDEAAANVAAMFRVAEHATHDRILISSLVGVAISAAAREEAETLLASKLLTPSGRAMISQAMERVLTADPFLGKAAVESERDIFLGWTQTQFARGPKYRAVVIGLAGGNEENASAKTRNQKITNMTDAEVSAEIAKAKDAYKLALVDWDSPDASKTLTDITQRVERGEFGLIAQVLFPSLTKARNNLSLETSKVRDLAKRLKEEN
ncbi:MAG: hypothetical protein AABZ53_12915 [Planctomycetota bacterium]